MAQQGQHTGYATQQMVRVLGLGCGPPHGLGHRPAGRDRLGAVEVVEHLCGRGGPAISGPAEDGHDAAHGPRAYWRVDAGTPARAAAAVTRTSATSSASMCVRASTITRTSGSV